MRNYYYLDNITWKGLLQLLKKDTFGKAVCTSIWQMARVLFMETCMVSLPLPLILLIAWLFQPNQLNLADLLLLIIGCPLILFAVVSPFAYVEYRRNRHIPFRIMSFIGALPDAIIIAAPILNYYRVRYCDTVFHILLDEPSASKGFKDKRTLKIGVAYYDPQERPPKDLFFEISEYAKGKIPTHFSFTNFSLFFDFPYNPAPDASQVRKAADMLLYLLQRCQLDTTAPEEEYNDEEAD